MSILSDHPLYLEALEVLERNMLARCAAEPPYRLEEYEDDCRRLRLLRLRDWDGLQEMAERHHD